MTSGLLFYWFSWILWVYVTFIMKKCKGRTLLAIWILLILSGSTMYVTMLGYQITMSYLFLAIGSLIMIAKSRHLYFHLFSSLTIMILYMAMMVWENYFPIWMIVSKAYISPLIIVLVIVFISKGLYNRVSIALLGISTGELMYSFILSSYAIRAPIGDHVFFDSVLIILFIFIGVEVTQIVRVKIRSILHIYKRSFRILSEE